MSNSIQWTQDTTGPMKKIFYNKFIKITCIIHANALAKNNRVGILGLPRYPK